MKKLWRTIKSFLNNIKGFFMGFWILYIYPKDQIFSFYGYGHFRFARDYADKRVKRNGLRHWVLPAGKGAEQLIVFNIVEKKMLTRRGFINKININDMLKQAYYITPR